MALGVMELINMRRNRPLDGVGVDMGRERGVEVVMKL